MVELLLILIACLILFIGYLVGENSNKEELDSLRTKLNQKDENLRDLTSVYNMVLEERNDLFRANKKVVNQKKSSEVRTGQIAEQMAPFLSDYPYDPKNTKFLGMPIDLIIFDEEGVHFVEVKSGSSSLSKKQREIRNQIKEGKVSFEVYRIKGE